MRNLLQRNQQNAKNNKIIGIKKHRQNDGVFYCVIYFLSTLTGSAGAFVAGVLCAGWTATCPDANSSRKADCLEPEMSVFATTNDNSAHNIKNIVAKIAVVLVRKFPAAEPVKTPPNIDAAVDPDIPEPSDFCNKIKPVIKTATITNKTSKIENIVFPFVFR